jgi:hypothetical protein
MKRSFASCLVGLMALGVLAAASAEAARLVRIADDTLVMLPEFRCFVQKAVPAPERGPTFYTHSYIGDVWLKGEPVKAQSPLRKEPVAIGTLKMFRTDRVYEELLVYPDAVWLWVDDEGQLDRLEGYGDRSKSQENAWDGIPPLFFTLSRISKGGLLHGRDGRPAYFLSDCTFSDALRQLSPDQKAAIEDAGGKVEQKTGLPEL